jgi:hypothetical protein
LTSAISEPRNVKVLFFWRGSIARELQSLDVVTVPAFTSGEKNGWKRLID